MGLAQPFLFLFFHAVISCLAPAFIEYSLRNKGRKALAHAENLLRELPRPLDDDVMREILTCSSADTSSVVINKLVKEYISKGKNKKPFLAVKGLSLKISPGEVVSLLGPNSSGKSTTISMLAGEIPASAGTASVFGNDIRNQMDDIHSVLGICPQHNAMHDSLSVIEHLKIFAAICGISKQEEDLRINDFASRFGLSDYLGRRTTALSGGYKRRVQLALACIGRPRLLLLDEPSSALSPDARRSLWKLIQEEQRRGCAVLLTTHSMPEAEFLSSRIAIMVKGTLRCIGSSQHLKSLYGSGYKLTLGLTPKAKREDVAKFVSCIIPGAQESTFIPKRFALYEFSANVPLSNVFGLLETGKDSAGIDDFTISLTTLEQVFIRFAKLSQKEEDDGEL
ncbi:hypothetical protein RCL1_006319 [Eukaryota sp. TZLM3-RCL]